MLKAENAALSSERDALKTLLSDFELGLTDLQQYSRNTNIEIKGLPVTKDENLHGILLKIGEVIKEPIATQDVDICHRAPVKKTTCPNIIVKFGNLSKRDVVLERLEAIFISAKTLPNTLPST